MTWPLVLEKSEVRALNICMCIVSEQHLEYRIFVVYKADPLEVAWNQMVIFLIVDVNHSKAGQYCGDCFRLNESMVDLLTQMLQMSELRPV